MSFDLRTLPGAEGLAEAHAEAGAQPDNLCGPYWVAILIRAAGLGMPSSEEAAVAAGTLLPSGGDPRSWVPPGEPNREPGPGPSRRAQAQASGTSIQGMLAAVEELSHGTHRFVPVRARGGERLDVRAIDVLLGTLEANPGWRAAALLNVRFGRLWDPATPPLLALGFLAGGDAPGGRAWWDVGHFVNVAGRLVNGERSLLLLRDSYASFGWAGHHLQPPGAVADALRRDDGREGGCLLFVSTADAAEVERTLKEADFDVGIWDNGTPYEGTRRNGGRRR